MASCKEASEWFCTCKMLPLTDSDFGSSDSLWEISLIRLQSHLHSLSIMVAIYTQQSCWAAQEHCPILLMHPARCLRCELGSQIPDNQRKSLSTDLLSISEAALPATSFVRCEENLFFFLGSLAGVEGPCLWAMSSETHCAFSFCSSPYFFSPRAYNIFRMTFCFVFTASLQFQPYANLCQHQP